MEGCIVKFPEIERRALIERMHDDLIHTTLHSYMYYCALLAHNGRVSLALNAPELLICNRRRNVYLFKVTHYRGKQAEPTVFTPQTSRSISHYKLGGIARSVLTSPNTLAI